MLPSGRGWQEWKAALGIRFGSNGRQASAEISSDGVGQDDGSGNIGLVKELADHIKNGAHFARDGGGRLYVFTDGVYRPTGELYVKRQVKHLPELSQRSGKWSSHRAQEVVEYIGVDAPQLWERPPLDVVNVRNGLLEVTTRTLRPHSPEFLSPV